MTTLYAMTIDTEEEWDWGAGWPSGRPSVENIGRLPRFQDLCSRLGVATTYFVDLAVLDDPDAQWTVRCLADRDGVEIGMHIHPWNTPPRASGATPARESFLHNLPDHLAVAKLGVVYGRFLELGLAPTSFRGGRYSCGDATQGFLRDRGFLADASVVPFTTWADDGAPDYRHRGLEPVRKPPRFEGDSAFWEVPLTLGFSRGPDRVWRWCFDLVENSWLSHLHPIGIAERLGLVRRVWLSFEDPAGRKMVPFLERLRRLGLPCITFSIHSSSLLAGGSPYTKEPADEDRLLAQLEEVFGILGEWDDFRPATVTEIARALEESHHASARHQPVG
jgi:hypothetical protein